MKIYLFLGHPNTDATLASGIADAYEAAAKAAGHEVRRADIGKLQFDPILHKGYRAIQELEPDLKKVQEDITWADHFVLIYPLWWSSVPALLKGMIDRMWLPRFAFSFIKAPDGKSTMGWHRLLKGRTARVIILLKNFPIIERFLYGNYTSDIVNAVLRFSGFKVRLTEVGNSEALSDKAKASWMKKIEKLARKGR
ncbi:MAG TPA: NAD(P)H-dependent oxidoreductase [Candidatus Paceibacterota bacterium]|nr:NAD(P)H-dependent oxidoreductase [Candidatus Paceibacterota bacterium]